MLSLQISPLVSWALIAAIASLSAIAVLAGLLARLRGAWLRALALTLFCLALLNPVVSRQERETLPNVVAVVVDRSASQSLDRRGEQTKAVRAALEEKLKALPDAELRFVEAGQNDQDGTHLFAALAGALANVPPDRVGGAILVTDGQVHDIPANAAKLGFHAPLHVLVTGKIEDQDRRIVLVNTPRFGIVGKPQILQFRIDDVGPAASIGSSADLVIRRDGETLERRQTRVGEVISVEIPVNHAGENIVEIEVGGLPGELTEVNNHAVVSIQGVRDKLQVLLVSGEPHAGERTWRNLLKADANVDLVHFTILRPPDKQDGTPVHELSLIAFPTRELFAERLSEFDLVIFDRYAQEGLLPSIYFENIADYVRNGGAVLLASGPDYASPNSLWGTPLADILPAEPTGRVIEEPFRPKVTDLGRRHPITRALPGGGSEPPKWGEWFRVVETRGQEGTSIMSGAQNQPLLILARHDKGRVALLLSDHAWLWARGYDGGGPHVDLLRRLSHWLMKEPDLEEEALRARVDAGELIVERQTIADKAGPATITGPDGRAFPLPLTEAEPGLWRGSLKVDRLGLWRITDGALTALAHAGPVNPREYRDVVSTTAMLQPIAGETRGSIQRIAKGEDVVLPRIASRPSNQGHAGEGWIAFREAGTSVVRGIATFSLFSGLLGLGILVGALALVWGREAKS